MSAQSRYPVVPTVTVLAVMKVRLQGATKGHALLKKKADALTVRFRAILRQIIEAKEAMGQTMRDSFFTLIEARYAAGDSMRHTVFDNVEAASVKVYARQDNVAGVKIPKFEHVKMGTGADLKMDLTGLGSGGQKIQNCRKSFTGAVELLVELANLQTAFITLDDALKVTNRRVNALENVVKPKLENTISYIKGELDELEREDFFRLKIIQNKKQRDMAQIEKQKAEAAAVASAAENGEQEQEQGKEKEQEQPPSLLALDDPDIIF
eukprot:evm.model.scf_479.1 EVM.evm.TU.scf_479.1   scf_479:3578-6104(+)